MGIILGLNFNHADSAACIVKNGKLIVDYKKSENPESFLSKKGRKRNYGY